MMPRSARIAGAQCLVKLILHGINDRVDRGEDIAVVMTEAAQTYPKWAEEVTMWHERWIDMASPCIEHSVRLMDALQAKRYQFSP